jgi:hypothetical protein
MNLNSYVRLNPYFEDEKNNEAQPERNHTLLVSCVVATALLVLCAWAWTPSDVVITHVPLLRWCKIAD